MLVSSVNSIVKWLIAILASQLPERAFENPALPLRVVAAGSSNREAEKLIYAYFPVACWGIRPFRQGAPYAVLAATRFRLGNAGCRASGRAWGPGPLFNFISGRRWPAASALQLEDNL
jgi:hypothetical protein